MMGDVCERLSLQGEYCAPAGFLRGMMMLGFGYFGVEGSFLCDIFG